MTAKPTSAPTAKRWFLDGVAVPEGTEGAEPQQVLLPSEPAE